MADQAPTLNAATGNATSSTGGASPTPAAHTATEVAQTIDPLPEDGGNLEAV